MKRVDGRAVLVDADGVPRSDVTVTLEHFRLGSGWSELATAVTDADGKVAVSAALTVPARGSAPACRLTEDGTAIAAGGEASYAGRSGVLAIDFGQIRQPRSESDAEAAAAGGAELESDTPLLRPGLAVNVGRVAQATAFQVTPDLRTQVDRLRVESDDKDRVILQRDTDLRNTRAALELERQRRETAERLAQTGEADAVKVIRVQRDQLNVEKEVLIGRVQERESALEQATKRQEQAERLAAERAQQAEVLIAEKRAVVPIGDIALNLSKQVNAARTKLAASADVMKIAGVRFKVRGKLGEKGEGLLLPGIDGVGSGDQYDEFDFDLAGADAAADPQVVVPDVTRLTESAARQVLASLGLRMDPATMPPTTGFVVGQAMRQAPVAGQSAGRGATVIVVFAA